jgi:hypothetical protein
MSTVMPPAPAHSDWHFRSADAYSEGVIRRHYVDNRNIDDVTVANVS